MPRDTPKPWGVAFEEVPAQTQRMPWKGEMKQNSKVPLVLSGVPGNCKPSLLLSWSDCAQ